LCSEGYGAYLPFDPILVTNMRQTNNVMLAGAVVLFITLFINAVPSTPKRGPEYTADAQLKFPADYRQWVFLSSGVGMTYGPLATVRQAGALSAAAQPPPMFDNVFVNPDSYRPFLRTGHWPDKTMFVLEVRDSESHGSINNGGHFQTDIMGIETEVKDGSSWSFYAFSLASGTPQASAKAIPRTASCYSCHSKNTAVENTFVQFYPELYEVAEQKGTLNPGFEKLPISAGKLFTLIRNEGWTKGAIALEEASSHSPDAVVLAESSLNSLAYRLIQSRHAVEAVKLVEWATTRYERSANLQDTLADAYLAEGNKSSARNATERSLALAKDDTSLSDERRQRLNKAAEDRLKLLQ
jgi:hypothetical protein